MTDPRADTTEAVPVANDRGTVVLLPADAAATLAATLAAHRERQREGQA